MPIHQLELTKRDKNDTDEFRVANLLRGKTTLRSALAPDDRLLESYRRQAEVLFRAENWRGCADVVEGLIALDAAGTQEVMLLVRAYEALGEHDKAVAVAQILEVVLAHIEEQLMGMEVAR
jgi:hypothetical protein